METTTSIDELVQFIRYEMSISDRVPITEDSMLESDLGITGDDGVDLINAIEKAFDIVIFDSGKPTYNVFNLKENEYLFHSEGWDFWGLIQCTVKPISVGDLHQAIVKLQHNHTDGTP